MSATSTKSDWEEAQEGAELFLREWHFTGSRKILGEGARRKADWDIFCGEDETSLEGMERLSGWMKMRGWREKEGGNHSGPPRPEEISSIKMKGPRDGIVVNLIHDKREGSTVKWMTALVACMNAEKEEPGSMKDRKDRVELFVLAGV